MLMNTGVDPIKSQNGLLTTIAASTGERVEYALEGSVFVAGAAIQWLRDEMRMLKSTPQSEEYCTAVEDTNGVYLVPAFTGIGAPYWNQYARGMMVGLTRGASKEHFIRAAVESLAYQANDLLNAMKEESGLDIRSLRVDGGACANNFLMQFQSDISRLEIKRPEVIETTALGAGYLAGLATGFWKDKSEIYENWNCNREFVPMLSADDAKKRIKGWNRAVKAALYWAEESLEEECNEGEQ